MLLLVVAALLHTAVTAQYLGSGKCAEPKYMCHQANGDGAGGSEALVKTNVASLHDCFKLVKKADSKANGATWGKKNKKCYKEVGMTKISKNSNYVTCFILVSGERRALAAEKALGQFSWLDQKPDESVSKGTYHKKGGEACTQHYECVSGHCIWTYDMSDYGHSEPKGDIHCGDGYYTTSCDECTYGEDEPEFCGGDCEWDGWDCVDASAMESQVGFRANVASTSTSTLDVVTYGFAALGASVVLYGAFRHYTSSSKGDSTSVGLA